MHLDIWYVVLVCHQYDVGNNYVGSVFVGVYGGQSESGLCVFRELCLGGFLIVGESPSALLLSVVLCMLIVMMISKRSDDFG